MPGTPPREDDDGSPCRDETTVSIADGGDETESPDTNAPVADGDDDHSRRTLIRVLLALGLGLPILIELRTFVSLVGSWFGGDDGGATPTETPPPDGVGEGDELLPETPAVERLRSAAISASDGDTWPFTVVVDVDNSGEAPYRFRLGAVTTAGGTVVEGGAGTDRLDPGESTTVATTWSIPEGSTPRTIAVRGETFGDGTPEAVEREVVLGKVPVEG